MVRIPRSHRGDRGSIPLWGKRFFFLLMNLLKPKKLRTKLTKELNDLDNDTKNKTLLDSIFYWYYSKDLQAKKSDNKGIRLIKKFVFKIYQLMKETSKETSSVDEQDA